MEFKAASARSLFLVAWLVLACTAVSAETITGEWLTLDDKTGLERSIIEIYEKDGALHGKVRHIFPKPHEDPDPFCVKCPGDKKGVKVLGMEIIWGLRKDGTAWRGGHVLDPESGKVYKCKMSLEEGKLKVRGYLGLSLLGRTQTWLPAE